MTTILVGYTGFVGSNICQSYKFDALYNSKNINEAFGTNPDLLVYSGVPAQKFLANKDPEKDYALIQNAINNIKAINPKRIVLISTIDVYKNPVGIYDTDKIECEELEAYGKNRFFLEDWVQKTYENSLIIHLPALYGKNIKKNFIYDMIHIIPSMIKEEKFLELTSDDNLLLKYYEKMDNGFYKYIGNNKEDEVKLKNYFMKIGFTALAFTDSRAIYQFYNLSYLWNHIKIALDNDIRVLNLAVEPVSAQEIYSYVRKQNFENEISEKPIIYDFKTAYDELFGGNNGYIFSKQFILEDVKKFVEEEENA